MRLPQPTLKWWRMLLRHINLPMLQYYPKLKVHQLFLWPPEHQPQLSLSLDYRGHKYKISNNAVHDAVEYTAQYYSSFCHATITVRPAKPLLCL